MNRIARAFPLHAAARAESDSNAAAPSAAPRGGELRPLVSPTRVLVADDDVEAAAGLAVFLDALGYEVRTAHNGATTLEVARRWQPEAILLDISMPLIDGNEVCRRLRQEHRRGRRVLIAAVTGFGGPNGRRSRDAGFDYYLVKPVDPWLIFRLLRSL